MLRGYAKCIDDSNWLGTKYKTYEIKKRGTRISKDVRFDGDDYKWIFYEVRDDKEQLVQIPADCFEKQSIFNTIYAPLAVLVFGCFGMLISVIIGMLLIYICK